MKIIDKILESISNQQLFFSFEYFPPKTEEGVANLFNRIDRMAKLHPAFIDVTWGAGGSTSATTLEISSQAKKLLGVEVLMHITCTNMTIEDMRTALDQARDNGIQNILALRGDPPKGTHWKPINGGFHHAVDLVRFIRKEYGDAFCIAVAGYPEGHMESNNLQEDIQHLKEKIDAGADFVITQLFYDFEQYRSFLDRCKEFGITCPIIPGIMPIQNYSGFLRMTRYCRAHVPEEILNALEPIKDSDEDVRNFAIQLGVDMCQKLIELGCPGLHFYTLNLEKTVVRIIENLQYVEPVSHRRPLPWRRSADERRATEDVRPIFWANNTKSYLIRTESWDEFPNGRWGDSRSPAFGNLSDLHFADVIGGDGEELRAELGESIQSFEEIYDIFVRFLKGEISRIPWSESGLHAETATINLALLDINSRGFLTINSQPRVNAIPSSDPVFGWGGPGGYVYQKEYLEFFCSPDNLRRIMDVINSGIFSNLTYTAVDFHGNTYTNQKHKGPTALTWGVFPNHEIVQPTVADLESFMVWKGEAFQRWLVPWAELYDEESKAHELLHEIHDSFYLVHIIDHDFINGNIFALFDQVKVHEGGSSRYNSGSFDAQ